MGFSGDANGKESCVLSLGQEDPLEEGMATHSSTLAYRFLWTEEPEELQSTESDMTEVTWHTECMQVVTSTSL